MLRLRCEQLESRDTPANIIVGLDPAISLAGFPGDGADLIPDWNGDIQVSLGDVNGDHILDVAAVAQDGGSARIVVYDGATKAELGSFIAFDPSFRGGAHAIMTNVPQFASTLLVVPGPGGGPVVQEYRFVAGSGFQIIHSELLPYDAEYRGGLQVSTGPVTSLQSAPDAFFLPAVGSGGPQLVVMDLATGEVVSSFYAGPVDETDVEFEPSGGTITIPSGVTADGLIQFNPPHRLGIVVQDGPVVDGHVDSRVYDVLSGVDVTAHFPVDGLPEPPPV